MNRRISLIALFALFCGLPAMLMAGGGKQGGEQVVAGIVFQEDQFMKLLSLGYADAAKEAGFRILQANTGNDQAREAELINTYVDQKVAGIAIAPLSKESSVATLKRASDAGVKIAVTNINLSNAPFIVGGYTSDDKNLGATVGASAADFIKTKLNGNAKVAIPGFYTLLPEQAAARVDGFKEAILKVNPNVQFLAPQEAWLQDVAVQKAGDLLTANPDIDIIYGSNDGGTIGSVMAVKNAGRAGKTFVFGIDTGDQQIAMLRDSDNILQAVTGQDPYSQGYNAMKVLADAVNGKDVSKTQGKTVIVDGLLVSRSDPAGIDKFEKELAAKLAR
ncbi:sugar ABC transporter substrate-binding protein [Spirochaetia bacterium]|nr:sugar ABC transporter substrate-binding protein [Spirochaetia bacterium]